MYFHGTKPCRRSLTLYFYFDKKMAEFNTTKFQASNSQKHPPLTSITQNEKGRNERVYSSFTKMSPRGYDGGYTNSCATNNHHWLFFFLIKKLTPFKGSPSNLFIFPFSEQKKKTKLFVYFNICLQSLWRIWNQGDREWENVGLLVSYWDYHLLLSLLFSL